MKYTCGALFSDIDVRDYKVMCTTSLSKFPREYELATYRVKSQGDTGSCVAHALSSIIEYYNAKQLNDSTEMSVGYIYGNRKNSKHTGPGMIVRDALSTVVEYGDVPKAYFPYNVETPRAIELYDEYSERLYDAGRPNRISSYCRVNTVGEAKQALMSGIPLLMAMNWYNDMVVDENGVLHTNYTGDAGGHCMYIYGWNERGWKVQNSWGKDWGVDGRFILPYEIGMAECWAVMDNIVRDIQIKKPFSSQTGKIVAKIINKIANVIRFIW